MLVDGATGTWPSLAAIQRLSLQTTPITVRCGSGGGGVPDSGGGGGTDDDGGGGGGGVEPSTTTPETYGDDPAFDALWDECAGGWWSSCDALYRQAPPGSRYEEYGITCGDRNTPQGYCVTVYDAGDDP